MVNATWLHTFRTLVEVGHFTQTAEKLFMTQPGVSQHIKKLERDLGSELIRREGKTFELTEQGHIVYQYAVNLAKHEDLLKEQLSFDNPHQGAFHIAAPGAIATAIYPELIKLQTEYRGLSTHLEAGPNRKIIQDVLSGSADIGIVTYMPNQSELTCESIGHLEISLVMPKNHPPSPSILSDIESLGVVAHPDAQHYFEKFFEHSGDKALQDLDWSKLTKVTYINQLSQILQPVAMGVGLTVLPKIAINHSAYQNQVSVTPTPNVISEPLYLIKKKRRELPARYQTLLSILKGWDFS
ncbi:LysR family transcriptional regulator [Vibrio nomapromontoriensis]|uniref:LysR family transcriptional regulator n=1 Tax=Vibrio nomapromontoriensis TaxID=2910246 RepID=UPI003D0DDDB6